MWWERNTSYKPNICVGRTDIEFTQPIAFEVTEHDGFGRKLISDRNFALGLRSETRA
jgi:hypothetical protein